MEHFCLQPATNVVAGVLCEGFEAIEKTERNKYQSVTGVNYMQSNSLREPRLSAGSLSRRQFMQLATGSAIATGAGLSRSWALGAENGGAPEQGNRPNIVLIITDQERSPQYWPAGWADANLPNRKRLADHGLTFTRAFCNAAMCSPSRATLFTGLYPAQHGVEHTLTTGGSLSPNEPTLQPTTQNMARLLASAGYNVQYRGKWHLTKDVTVPNRCLQRG